MKEHTKQQSKKCIEALRELLIKGTHSTQDEIGEHLTKLGYEVNQSKISRMLRKISASKTTSKDGKIVYKLPKDPGPPNHNTRLSELVIDITHNDNLIIIFTSPGSASLISRILDHNDSLGILGSIAGDDTIFVAPESINKINDCLQNIKILLYG